MRAYEHRASSSPHHTTLEFTDRIIETHGIVESQFWQQPTNGYFDEALLLVYGPRYDNKQSDETRHLTTVERTTFNDWVKTVQKKSARFGNIAVDLGLFVEKFGRETVPWLWWPNTDEDNDNAEAVGGDFSYLGNDETEAGAEDNAGSVGGDFSDFENEGTEALTQGLVNLNIEVPEDAPRSLRQRVRLDNRVPSVKDALKQMEEEKKAKMAAEELEKELSICPNCPDGPGKRRVFSKQHQCIRCKHYMHVKCIENRDIYCDKCQGERI